jgi:hypothetical protein
LNGGQLIIYIIRATLLILKMKRSATKNKDLLGEMTYPVDYRKKLSLLSLSSFFIFTQNASASHQNSSISMAVPLALVIQVPDTGNKNRKLNAETHTQRKGSAGRQSREVRDRNEKCIFQL